MKRTTILFTLVACLLPARAASATGRPMTVDDLFKFKRVADPQISPDGKSVVYTLTTVDLAGNKTTSALWLAPVDGGRPRAFTTAGKKDSHPRWSPDGRRILFESNRAGDTQLWVIDLHGGEARQLTSISTEAHNAIWSPDGKSIAFASAVYPEYSAKPYAESNALNKKRKDDAESNPVKARVFTRLFFRHWDDWVEDKRLHLFVMSAAGGQPRDVTPGDHDAYPTSDTFSAGDDFTFSPDGKFLLFTAPPEKHEAWTTDYNVYRVPVAGGKKECLTADNKAADGQPHFAPSGKLLAYRAQQRAGFEADRWQLMVVDCDESGTPHGTPHSITSSFGGSVQEYVWAVDSNTIFFTADENANTPIFTAYVNDRPVERFHPRYAAASLSISRDGNALAFTLAALDHPPRVRVMPTAGGRPRVIDPNLGLLRELDRPRPESVTVPGAGGTPMQMWILKPPGFTPAKKWPLAVVVHGGPQGAWEDGWSYRWNPELWAAQGYVVALPNPRGSTGFGQKYVDEISGDWGGKCFDDLMAGVAYLEKLPYIDKDRMAAAGASFGGYMMNWFEGHTTRFKTLISHDGVYNFESMYATTDELWFDEWEHGGPPWQDRRSYDKFSPHRYAANFKTPMLIIHNDLDFRCPVGEGLQLFTTLQRLGVPSKMINFPDEGHWVLKPANSAYWHRQVFAWLKKYVPPGGR
jgi:dipeptidyl aminopeptidase/acylaminoacyl peptidase